MKNLYKLIILLVSFFSITNLSFASENWEIWDLLDIENASIKYELSNINTNEYSFSNEKNKKVYNRFKVLDTALKNKLLEKINNWDFSYNWAKWIINTYKNFVYRVNKTYEYLNLKEKSNNPNLSVWVEKNIEQAKTHYKRLQYLISINK